MHHRELIADGVIVAAVISLFFYQVIFRGLIPFPGDLLIAEYQPWKSESYLGYNPGSFPHKAQYPDTLRQLYPWQTLSTRMWREGQLPLWNPYNFSGTPLLANFQSAVFYPFRFLSLILPEVWAWTIMIIFQPLLTLIFTYLYCRKLNLAVMAAWLGAIAFAFSAFMTVWLQYNTVGQVIIWLPLVLLAIENLRDKFTSRWAVILSVFLALALLAGHPQVFFYLFVFSLIYAWFRKTETKNFLKVSSLMLLGLGLGAIQLIPGLELIGEAARSPHPIDIYLYKILIQPWQLIMMIVPDFFGNPATRSYWPLDTYVGKVTSVGLTGLILALLSLKLIGREKIVRFFVLSSLIILVLITANPLTSIIYRFPLPFISSSSPTLATFLLAFSLAILAAYGADFWLKKPIKLPSLLLSLLPLILIMSILWLTLMFLPKTSLVWATQFPAGRRSLILETLILTATGAGLAFGTIKPKFKYFVLISLILIESFDLFIAFRKFNPFVPPDLVFPNASVFNFLSEQKKLARFWGHGAASVQPNFSAQYSLFSPEGYDPLYPRRYGELIQSSVDGKIHTNFTSQTRSDAVIAPSYGDGNLQDNPFRLRLLDLLGTDFILDRLENGSTEKSFPPDRFRPLWRGGGWIVFQNLKAAPRFFLAKNVENFGSHTEFANKFFSPSFDPGSTVLLEKRLPTELAQPAPTDRVTLSIYRANEVVFQTSAQGRRLLFLSDTDYPGWQAFIDNRETEILRADYAFRAVLVPAGDHKISFIFQPVSFTIGTSITLISLAAIGILVILRKLRGYA